ncbi:hypothetical protein CEXT_501041 [Caerostris extrusa]|uniref:Uncharacterized protein n=1 Tax=Caerostris extrusa TaxID=172846 RepID=A0AAV4MTP6_CAEEX|nr:hypothetical protein CEXT_501041 [Caerostris extrusa]
MQLTDCPSSVLSFLKQKKQNLSDIPSKTDESRRPLWEEGWISNIPLETTIAEKLKSKTHRRVPEGLW